MITSLALLLLLVAALDILIGFYAWYRNPKSGPNQTFCCMAMATAAWAIGVALVCIGPLPPTNAGRLATAAASLIPTATFALSRAFPGAYAPRPDLMNWAALASGLACSAVSFTPMFVLSVERLDNQLLVTRGKLYPVFAAHIIAWFSLALLVLAEKYVTASGTLRSQTRLLLLAISIPISLGVTTNLLLPLFLGTSRFSPFGPLFSLIMVVLVAHAIIRHRLMDIRLVIKRGVVYLVAFGIAGTVLVGLLLAMNAWEPGAPATPVREMVVALLVAVFFQPLKVAIQRMFDRYLYREPWDYQRTLREASGALVESIHLPVLLGRVADVLQRTLRPERIVVYLLEEDEAHYERAFVRGAAEGPESLALDTALVTVAARERCPVFRDELGRRPGSAETDRLRDDLERLGIEVAVPLFGEAGMIGLLAVGPKRSGDPFFSDDADLLTTLANQSAVAVRNAQEHQQVVRVSQELQKILDTIESGVVAIDRKGRIRLCNRAAEALIGIAADALQRRPVANLPAALASLLQTTAAGGVSRSQVEFALPDAAGQLLPLLCSTSPLRDADHQVIGVVAVFSDLSRLQELEQEKRRAERLASLEAIASGMVHEIRNPLVSLKAFTQLIPVRFGDAQFRDKLVRVADREISRIEGLLGRFRTLASAGSQPMEPVDVRGPLQAALELLEPQREERRIRLRQVGDGTPRPVRGNSSQLQQLFYNLCLNALESMHPGGELTVRVADLCEAGGTTLLVEISDTGAGIPEDLVARIFDPFVTTKAQGSGLGLAICRSVADAHRATLSARNNVGRPGATFTLEFPVAIAARAPLPA